MDIVKKNLVSIICGVVAILAIVLSFIPLGGQVTALQTQLSARAAKSGELDSVLKQSRKLPVLSLTGDATADAAIDLPSFPTRDIIAQGNAMTAKFTENAAKVVDLVVRQNNRTLLVPDSLPAPSPTNAQRFLRTYIQRLALPGGAGAQANSAAVAARLEDTMAFQKMQCGIPPVEAYIKTKADEITAKIRREQTVWSNGVEINKTQVDAAIAAALETLPEDLKKTAATQSKIYINLDATDLNPKMIGTAPPAPTDIFFAQVGYWIQSDIFDAIADINKNANNVADAPIKHLIKIDIPDDRFLMGPIDPAAPAPTPGTAPDFAQPVTKNYQLSPTGRVSNPLFDVMRFTVKLNVEAGKLPAIIESFSRGRFISVVNVVSVVGEDSILRASQGYIYGPKPVVQITLDCEAVFLREWLVKFMPETLKIALGLSAPPVPVQ